MGFSIVFGLTLLGAVVVAASSVILATLVTSREEPRYNYSREEQRYNYSREEPRYNYSREEPTNYTSKEKTKKKQKKNEKKITLYHYTNVEGINGIKRNRRIKASTDEQIDATKGKGIYLTDLDPSEPNEKIAKNNWGAGAKRAEKERRLDYAVEIDMDSDLVEFVEIEDRSFYLHKAETLKLKDFKVYKRNQE